MAATASMLGLVRTLLALLAIDRETMIVAALAALIVAGTVVSIGAWILLVRDRRTRRGGPASG
jgi:hypothetical protein